MNSSSNKGFTLVEMSIVLIIIGLLVAGVLTGQDLIKQAQIRATVTQIQSYDAAINTFRNKYNGLPGDFGKAVAFLGGTQSGILANRDNGVFDDADGADAVAATMDGELQDIWAHLSLANMISGSYLAAGANPSESGTHIPATKLKKGTIIVLSEGSANYWIVGAPSSIAVAGLGATLSATANKNIAPAEAYGIDFKLDDGDPSSGQVGSVETVTSGTGSNDGSIALGAVAADDCIAGTVGNEEYDVANETNECMIRIRIQG